MAFAEARAALDQSLASLPWSDPNALIMSIELQLTAPETICAEERIDAGSSGQQSAQPRPEAASSSPTQQFPEKLLKYRTNCALHALNLLRGVGTRGLDSMQSLSLEDDDAPPPPSAAEGEGEGSLAMEKLVVGTEDKDTKKAFPREWRLTERGTNYQVMYRQGEEGSDLHEMCLEGISHAPLERFMAVSTCADYFKDWWPRSSFPTYYTMESRYAKRIAPGLDVCYVKNKTPWPLAVRDAVYTTHNLYDTSTGVVLGVHTPLPDGVSGLDPDLHCISGDEVPAVEEGSIRVEVTAAIGIQDFGDYCYFRLVHSGDVKIDNVPTWLVNFISRLSAASTYPSLRDIAQTKVPGAADDVFQQEMDSDPFLLSLRASMQAYRKAHREEIESFEEKMRTKGGGLFRSWTTDGGKKKKREKEGGKEKEKEEEGVTTMQGEVEKAFKLLWSSGEEEELEGEGKSQKENGEGRKGDDHDQQQNQHHSVLHGIEKALSFKWVHLPGSHSEKVEAKHDDQHLQQHHHHLSVLGWRKSGKHGQEGEEGTGEDKGKGEEKGNEGTDAAAAEAPVTSPDRQGKNKGHHSVLKLFHLG